MDLWGQLRMVLKCPVCLGTPLTAAAPGSAGGVGTAHGGATGTVAAAAAPTTGLTRPRKRILALTSPMTQMIPTTQMTR